MKSTQGCL